MIVEHLLSFLAVAIVLNLMPGPDMLVMAGQSLSGGQRAGLLAVWGLARASLSTRRSPCWASVGLWHLRRGSSCSFNWLGQDT